MSEQLSFEELLAEAAAERQRRWNAVQDRPYPERWREALVLKGIGMQAWRTRLMGACVYLQWGPEVLHEIEHTLSSPVLTEEQFSAGMAILDGELQPREYFFCLREPQLDFQL